MGSVGWQTCLGGDGAALGVRARPGYTTWEYESAGAGSAQVLDEIALGVTVVGRDTGSRAGREVVRAYMGPHSLDRGRPLRTLAAFATVTAKPGRAAEARLAIAPRAFAHDEASGGWVRPPGEFTVRIGRSSADPRLSVRVRSG